MEKRKKSIDETWNDVICNMTKDALRLIVYEHDCYSPKLIAIAKDVLKKKYGVTEDELLSIPEPDSLIDGDAGARNLLIEVLTKMGCNVSFDNDTNEDDGCCEMSFSYQNISYSAYANNEDTFVCIERFCKGCRMADKEKLARVMEAINEVNNKKHVKMYYQKDEEYDGIYVLCCSSFLLIPLIPCLDIYVYSQLKWIDKAIELFNTLCEQEQNG